jgi:LPS-assembly protein
VSHLPFTPLKPKWDLKGCASKGFYPCVLYFLFFSLFPLLAYAQALPVQAPPAPSPEYLISADTMENNEQTGVVMARGAVEIRESSHLLKADTVDLNQKTNVAHAQGHVSLTEADNTVLFAHELFLTTDMANGSGQNVAMLMPDDTRFAATDARRANNRYLLFNKGVFSPCNLCAANPREPPLWQVRAAKVTHDAEAKNLIYRDATLDMWGVPLLYTPYLSHPDPTVKRRQGLLAFTYGRNSDVGTFVRAPYYFDIAPDIDYTFAPIFSGQDGVRLGGVLRKRWEKGALKFDHSIVIADRTDDDGSTKRDQIRGHIAGNFIYNIDPVFRAGTDFFVQTDKNYMRRYSLSTDDLLTSRAFLEGFKGRDFGALEFFYFQDNRPGPRPEQPLIMPRIRYNALGEPNQTLGGRWSLDGIATSLQRDNGGTSMRKLGVTGGWERRDVLPVGLVTTMKGEVLNDIFLVDHLQNSQDPTQVYNKDLSERLFPQGQVTVSYPLAADYDHFSHVIEPIAALASAPVKNFDPRIPNEDSQDVEFDTTNLFELNRYPGTDQLEQGTRVTYGLRSGFYGHTQGMAEIMFGQNYRLDQDPQFPAGSGLETSLSDYVGQMRLEPGDWLHLDYAFRLDRDGLNFRKHDLSTNFGVPEFRPAISYINLDPPTAAALAGIGRVEEIRYGFTSQFAQYWTFLAERRNNLRPDEAGPLTTTFQLSYQDECLRSSLSFSRDNTVRTGVDSGDTFFFRIYFKHLGGIDDTPH